MNLAEHPLSTRSRWPAIVACLAFGWGASAFASQEKPIAWSELSALDLQKVLKSHYASKANLYDPMFSSSAHLLALTDADNRISQQFRIHQPMRNIAGFWLRVYTEFTTRHYVIYDKRHPEVVYDVLDFRDLFDRSRNLMAYEIVRERMIKKRFAEIHAAFRSVAAKSRKRTFDPNRLSPLEKRIHAQISKHSHKHTWREWEGGMRGQTGQRDNVMKGLLAAETFFPKMEEIFRQLDVPSELTRITLVESSFNLSAHSKAGARGVWQFMLLSGKEYMHVAPESGIDERISPLKSTVAAARLLKRNLVVSGNWPLAITAYNHGFTGIKRLTPAQRAEALDGRLFNPCQKRARLGYASANYYAEFLALLHAEKYRDLFYGESPLPDAPALTFHRLQKPMTAQTFAAQKRIGIDQIRLFNPDILQFKRKLPRGFFIAYPSSAYEMDELIDAIRPKIRARRLTMNTKARAR